MEINAWFKIIEKESVRKEEDIQWFKERIRQKFIKQNDLLSSISLSRN